MLVICKQHSLETTNACIALKKQTIATVTLESASVVAEDLEILLSATTCSEDSVTEILSSARDIVELK